MTAVIAILCALFGGAIGYFSPQISVRKVDLEVPNRPVLNAGFGALVGLVAGWGIGFNWMLPVWVWIIGIGTVLSLIDLEHKRLPDRLVLPSYPVVAVLLILPSVIYGDWSSYLRGIIAAVVSVAIYFVLALINPSGMGLGDVKLSGVLGLALGYLGTSFAVMGFFLAFVIGGIIGLGLMIAGKAGRKTAIPFGPFMVLGAAAAIPVAMALATLEL